MIKPAIVAVGYNRPHGMKRLLDSIGRAHFEYDDIPLIISIDQSNLSDDVEKVAEEFDWKYGTKEIRRFPERQGLQKHIVLCGDYSIKYGAVIILEDDLIVSEDFYHYVCATHEKYGDEASVCGVALYSYSYNVFTRYGFTPFKNDSDVFLGKMIVTWGQSWNERQWKKFKQWYTENFNKLPDINHEIPWDISTWRRSWGRYFANYMQQNNLKYIYPYISRTTCFSDYGEHNKNRTPLTLTQVPLMNGVPNYYKLIDIKKLIEYDAFYERVVGKDINISGIPGNLICFDLNNLKCSSDGKQFVVTNQRLPFKIIDSFGLCLRPISLNVINSIEGNELYLYELPELCTQIRKWKGKRPTFKKSLIRLKYEYYDMSWRTLLFYTPRELFSKFVNLIKK